VKLWVDLEGLDELIRDLVKDVILGDDLRIVAHHRDEFGNASFLVKLRRGQLKRLLPVVSENILKERYNSE
jgi:hypothetical protein